MWKKIATLVLLFSLTGCATPLKVATGSPVSDYLLASLMQHATGEIMAGASQGVMSAFNDNPYECRNPVRVRDMVFCEEKW